jgi:hypothetical protein
MADAPDIRASDSDRERIATSLRRHCSEGRLTLDELGERLSEAYAARTVGQLHAPDGPLRELPALSPPPPTQIVSAGQAPRPERRTKGFAEHLTSYLLVNLLLVAIWALSGFGYFWPVWSIVFWGFGVACHYVAVRRPGPPGTQRELRPR